MFRPALAALAPAALAPAALAPLALALAGTLPALPAAAQVRAANPGNDRLLRLDLAQRDGTLRRAVTNSGLRCGRLERSGFQGYYKNLAMWSARCTPGGDYAVFIGSDSTVQVRRCAELAAFKLPTCRLAPAAKRER